jgi:hypothetical protein
MPDCLKAEERKLLVQAMAVLYKVTDGPCPEAHQEAEPIAILLKNFLAKVPVRK